MGGKCCYLFLIILTIHELWTISHACNCKPCAHYGNQYQRCRCCTYHMVGGKRSVEYPYTSYGSSSPKNAGTDESISGLSNDNKYGDYTDFNFYLEPKGRTTNGKPSTFQDVNAKPKARDLLVTDDYNLKKRLLNISDFFKSGQRKPQVDTSSQPLGDLQNLVKSSSYPGQKLNPLHQSVEDSVLESLPPNPNMGKKLWWLGLSTLSLSSDLSLSLPYVSNRIRQAPNEILSSKEAKDILKLSQSLH